MIRVVFILSLIISSSVCAMERIAVSDDGRKLILRPSRQSFTPWGFNYDRDFRSRLIEEYWIDEWHTVESDFREMKAIGANIVRIHLSLAAFLESPKRTNDQNVTQLRRLVALCEELGIYLDITGLGCYRREAVPGWYADTGESDRWAIQAKFWEIIAEVCACSPAIAWFNLANEPVVPSDRQKDWLLGHLGGFWYCQYVTRDPAGRDQGEIARAWARQLKTAIRKHDPDTLITIGMLPFSSAPGQPSIGIDPPALKDELDLICVHLYPKPPPFEEAMAVLNRFDVGKPLVIEEFFPLNCDAEELAAFIDASQKHADGWISFYWGQSPDELASSTQPVDGITHDWLKAFKSKRNRLFRRWTRH